VSIRISSSAFAHNDHIPKRHTGDGDDLSPSLSWSELPAGTKVLAVICDDPDAPTPKPWVHWVIYNIPADMTLLPEGVAAGGRVREPAGTAQGVNSWGTLGYRGPAPPRGHGLHHYHFKLYALDTRLEVGPAADKDAVLAAIKGHVLAEGELIGVYQR